MAGGDRNYDIGTETKQNAILAGMSPRSPIRVDAGRITGTSGEFSGTGKGLLHLGVYSPSTELTLIVDGKTLISAQKNLGTNQTYSIEFTNSFTIKTHANYELNYFAVYY